MSVFSYIVLVVGCGLLMLGSVSGYALFARALKISDKFGDETNVGTLWGLFILGLSAGLLLVWWSLPS
ncbi:hypothetical protein [Paraglaciecola arctica]|uniref:Uncharacterized protein n=1 Tax=Paraglaciecola arctica BSs20135 TaxID=493475 RepID=K6YJ28_9ALTE|nr:hypothetical protein [Paraglaciecola arctica]GAC18177.1 hypothetical protein GARC_1197 [Paraglaciecola arctica BSs20135]|tara:strand:- start:2113 stop:2316 length:204 start_codon:yes stop_codon:yes gene_type:complete